MCSFSIVVSLDYNFSFAASIACATHKINAIIKQLLASIQTRAI
jgi:hypothetical protein